MINRIDIKLIFIASLSAVILSIFIFPLLQTLLYFLTAIQFDQPIGAYLFHGYFPLLLAGLYLGLTAKNSVFINGAVAGVLYNFIQDLISMFFLKNSTNFSWVSMIYSPIVDGVICGLVAWATFTTIQFLKKRKKRNV